MNGVDDFPPRATGLGVKESHLVAGADRSAGPVNHKFAGALVGVEIALGGEQRLFCQGIGLAIAAGEQQLADPRQRLPRPRVGAVDAVSFPERFFVELDAFARLAALLHGAETAIAQRQGMIPIPGMSPIPQANGRRERRQLHDGFLQESSEPPAGRHGLTSVKAEPERRSQGAGSCNGSGEQARKEQPPRGRAP